MNRLFQKKQNGVEDILFWTPPWIFLFLFFTLHLKIPDKTKPHPWKFQTFLLDPLKFQVQKPRNSTLFFLVTPSKSTSFLINPWKFYMLFLWYPWKICILNPPVLFFSGIAQSLHKFSPNNCDLPEFQVLFLIGLLI